MAVQWLQWSRIASFAYPSISYAGSESMTLICDFCSQVFISQVILNENPLYIVRTKKLILILQKYFMLIAEVCGTFVDSGCVCVLFKPNWIVRSKGGRWEEIDGNWSILNQDQARQASPCFGSRIKDETPRVSPLLDQKTTSANQGARNLFEGRRQK